MLPREREEYRALRATIRQQGTARIWVFLAGISIWAALSLATAVLTSTPLAVLVPLAVLAATFEGLFALDVAAERIGAYLQLFYDDRWEQTVVEFRRPPRTVRVDTLFVIPLLTAVLINIAPLSIANPVPVEWIFVGGAHALVVLRLVTARVAAGRQRRLELDRFRQLKTQNPTG